MRTVFGVNAIIVVLATITAPAFGQSNETAIIPGHSFGPVTVGMPARAARVAATRFERTTGCGIDLLVAHDVIAAAGSSWGGCLNLQLSSDTEAALARLSAGPFFVLHAPFVVGTGGPPAVLINAFGLPSVVRRGADIAVLVFANGLVAHVGATQMRGGVVDYLAVQVPGVRSIPRIGYLANVENTRLMPRYSDGGSGDGLGAPPIGP
jgi:hypothetical protein